MGDDQAEPGRASPLVRKTSRRAMLSERAATASPNASRHSKARTVRDEDRAQGAALAAYRAEARYLVRLAKLRGKQLSNSCQLDDVLAERLAVLWATESRGTQANRQGWRTWVGVDAS